MNLDLGIEFIYESCRGIVMDRFVNKKWKDISEDDKKELLKDAICRD
ncbi:hypothetical protein [Clostridium sp. BSD9I1]|nr:hypothetical protein [Clostridium sp. BSD9I1]